MPYPHSANPIGLRTTQGHYKPKQEKEKDAGRVWWKWDRDGNKKAVAVHVMVPRSIVPSFPYRSDRCGMMMMMVVVVEVK